MATPSCKTVVLSRGRHASPGDGVCVMELASMLAGEPFSDQPAAVSPVVGAFLRAYNDAATEEQRQRLYRYAADAVGTRACRTVERARARLCARQLELLDPCSARLARRLRLAGAMLRPDGVAAALGRAASHADAAAADGGWLRIVESLIEMSGAPTRAPAGREMTVEA